MRIKDYAELFAQNGYWRYKRAEKKKLFTDKSMQTREAVMKNWIVPLWGEYNPKRLTVQIIDKAMMGMTSDLTIGSGVGTTSGINDGPKNFKFDSDLVVPTAYENRSASLSDIKYITY